MVLAHSRWKARLKAAIENKEQIDTRLAGQDDQCELGKWIHGEGKRHANLRESGDLKTKHAKFHASIPDVISRARSSPSDALGLLDPFSSGFGRASSDCINAIVSLEKALANG
jgi:hypothetical protein